MGMTDINNAAAAQNALTARINAFLDTIDADIATRQAAYDALAGDLVGEIENRMHFDAYVYPDEANPTEIPNGSFNTIKDAIEAAPSGARVMCRLQSGKTHTIDADVQSDNKSISIVPFGAGDRPIIQCAAYVDAWGTNSMGGFQGAHTRLDISSCDITLPTAKADAGAGWNSQKRSLFLHRRAGGTRSLALQNLTVSGGLADVGLGVMSGYESGHSEISFFVATLDGPIFGLVSAADAITQISRTVLTLQNGAAVTDGGTQGTHYLLK